ncbi:UDP-N-acetylglucosamine 2-epimerase [Haladaptatus caseinilyticus]|uniref:UDP-N-acetylglucosamine 2-epimerase n=1 Tax=Haladaptatus caseinilyticus TaxID=2993314 RepID=UPI00224B7AD9|nr:UDP-N-acetylglucosamine 2-epimerase [Haladaptatus caseinilyticus]
MPTKKITVVTGTRAEYGLLSSSMAKIKQSPTLELTTVATGMHLSRRHGHTIDRIREDGFDVTDSVDTLLGSDTGRGMAKSLGLGIAGLAESFESIEPDVVLTLGDRGEAFGAGIAAAHMNIPVAHIHGGDAMKGATIDDSIRHALTKFAHIHFPATEASKQRILRLGEEEWRIQTVGAPGLDDVIDGEYDDAENVRETLDLDSTRPLAVVVQHPETTNPENAGEQMRQTLEAITEFNAQIVVIHPNADAGSQQIIETIRRYKASDRFATFESLPRRTYLGLLDTADVMVGNSSSAIIEAPSFGLPVVDVGPRQAGRDRAENVESVPHDTAAICDGIETALETGGNREYTNPYDMGGAADRIVKTLETISIDNRLLTKSITY